MTEKVIDCTWVWPKVESLDSAHDLLYRAILQEVPLDIHHKLSSRRKCEQALLSAILHPDCPDFSGFDLLAKKSLFHEIGRLRASWRYGIREEVIRQMVSETGFDPRTLKPVALLYGDRDRSLGQAMDRLFFALALARKVLQE